MATTVTLLGSGDTLYFRINKAPSMTSRVKVGQDTLRIVSNLTTGQTTTDEYTTLSLNSGDTGITETFTASSVFALATMVDLIAPFGGIVIATVFVTVATGGGSGVPCFLADAPVLTPSGYRPIASLHAGDKVQTADGRVVRIVEASHYRVPATTSTRPYVIPVGRFGATQDLHISPRHRVQMAGGEMVEAQHIAGLKQDASVEGMIDYYNLELPNWHRDNMVVAGVTVESKARVERYTVSAVEFVAMLKAQYGEVTPALLEKAAKVCRMEGGRVSVPVVKRA